MKQSSVDRVNKQFIRIRDLMLLEESPITRMVSTSQLDGMMSIIACVETVTAYYDENLGCNQIKNTEDTEDMAIVRLVQGIRLTANIAESKEH